MSAGRFQAEQVLEHGCRMLIPAGRHERFAPSAAEGMVGTFTWFEASEFGITERVRMRVVAAELVDGGAAIRATFEPAPRSVFSESIGGRNDCSESA